MSLRKAKSLCIVIGAIAAYYVFIIVAFKIAPDKVAVSGLTGEEARVATGFLAGVLAQSIFVAILILVARKEGQIIPLKAVFIRSTREGWMIAAIVATIELGFLYLIWIDRSIIHYAGFSAILLLTLLPAIDGIVQELFFRGFVIFRLKDAGFGPGFQVAISSIAFAGLHLGYGAGFDLSSSAVWLPVAGTFGFGLGLGFSVIKGRYSLLPAMICHTIVILAVQPWLAMT